MPNTSIIQPQPGEPLDTPKQFTNIDNQIFECTWDGIVYTVQPGETVIKPLYLVNYMAMHLARKILKREAYADKTDKEKMVGLFKWKNPEKEKELQLKMVAKNFPETQQEENVEFVCETCGFKSPSRAGLMAHTRKHK